MGFSRSRSGQSVIEVLVAIFILASMATAGFVLLSTTFSEGLAVSERTRADDVLGNGFEAVRQIRNQSFDLLTDGSHGLSSSGGTWSFAGTSDTDGIYQRTVEISTIDDLTRQVTVTVAWVNHLGRTEQRSAATFLTDWLTEFSAPASNCYGETATGDWSQPVVVGSADIGPGNQGTDLVIDYPYLYMSGVAASSAKPDLFVFDVSVPSAPALIDSIDTGPDGINSLALGDGFLVAASANNSREFMTIDITDPANIALAGYTNLSGDEDALSVTRVGDQAFLGRDDGATPEIYAYDVTVPATPSLLATFESAGEVNDFTASVDYVFAVTADGANDVRVIDISDPLVPVELTAYDVSAGSASESVAYNDPGVLFVGHQDGTFTPVDVSDPLVPVEYPSTSVGGSVKDMVCTNSQLVFIGTTNSNKEFLILDITDLNAVTEYASLNFPQVVGGLDFAANLVFAAVRSNDALRIITSSP